MVKLNGTGLVLRGERTWFGQTHTRLADNFSNQRKAIGMNATTWESYQNVIWANITSRYRLSRRKPSECSPREVQLSHDPGQSCSLPSRQGDICTLASLGKRLPNPAMCIVRWCRDGDVIHECQRFSADAQEIVDIHRHAIHPNALITGQ